MTAKSAALLRVVTGNGLFPRPSWLEYVMTLFDAHKSRIDLDRLTDEQLRDIGLTRQDVAEEMSRPIWDVPRHWRR